MIYELNRCAIEGVVGGALCGITSEVPISFGLEEHCIYTIIIHGMCDYTPCPPKFWLYA